MRDRVILFSISVVATIMLFVLIMVAIFRSRECEMISGLDIEKAPPGAILLTHIDGTYFWQMKVCKGDHFHYKNGDFRIKE